jgi:hypothetical protein
MLYWHKEVWLIDHGASLYFHHSWQNWEEQAKRPFVLVKDHVLLPQASEIAAVDSELKAILTPQLIADILALIPDEWLDERLFESAEDQRNAYAYFLNTRIENSSVFVKEAENARQTLI